MSASGRLAVEQRIVGLLALLALLHYGLLTIWIALALGPAGIALLDGPTLGWMIGGSLLATVVNVAHVSLHMPTTRWPRHEGAAQPSPWPLALAGAPSLLIWPLLIWRDRTAQAAGPAPEAEVELAFRELLSLPRTAAIGFAIVHAAATLILAQVVTRTTGTLGSLTLALALASLLPSISLAVSRIRAILVPEYLGAPRPDPLGLPQQSSLAWRLGGPAGLALLGAVLVPALAGSLWTEQLARVEALERAQLDAAALLHAAETGDAAALAATFEQNPKLGLRRGDTNIGAFPTELPVARLGPIDLDGDGRPDVLIADAKDTPQLRASVPLPQRHGSPLLTDLAIITVGLAAGFVALALLLRDVERDLGRASRQICAVVDGEIPEPMALETFATAELRRLVAAVDQLVGRITDANVHKYVLIERGHEAERLKSQFLANMSHDLRSPLNSVIGFSELLSSGIEGELSPDQLEMIGTIHRTGKDLLQQIDDILDTAKIEAGRMELHREPTPPATMISRAIQRARVRVDRPIEFDTVFAPGLPPAFVDPYRTTQALENVLLFAAEGLAQGVIEINCEAQREPHGGRSIVIHIGSPRALVPLAELEQARRGFFRLPGHTGLGLGLPIATSILEQQGGTFTIQGGESSSLGARAAMGFELRVPALTARKLPRMRMG